jgi:ribosomal protein S8
MTISQTLNKIEQAFKEEDSVTFNCYMAKLKMEVRAYCRNKGYLNEVNK